MVYLASKGLTEVKFLVCLRKPGDKADSEHVFYLIFFMLNGSLFFLLNNRLLWVLFMVEYFMHLTVFETLYISNVDLYLLC